MQSNQKKRKHQSNLWESKTQTKTGIRNQSKTERKNSFGSFRVYIFQFLLSVLQHRPSWNSWLLFKLGVVISQRKAVRFSPVEFLLYNMCCICICWERNFMGSWSYCCCDLKRLQKVFFYEKHFGECSAFSTKLVSERLRRSSPGKRVLWELRAKQKRLNGGAKHTWLVSMV